MTEKGTEIIKYVRVHDIICVKTDTTMMVNLSGPS